MAKIYTIVVFFLSLLDANAQTFASNFLGEDYDLYKKVLFKFEDTLKFKKTYIVDSIIERENSNPIFILRDTLNQEILRFQYDPKNANKFPFVTSKIRFKQKNVCDKIDRTVDDFSGTIKINSPILSKVVIYKEIHKNKTNYYLHINTSDNYCVVNGRSSIVIFQDGSRWVNSSAVDISVSGSKYMYSIFVSLSAKDLAIFSSKNIKKFRLYIFDDEMKEIEAETFKLQLQCVMNVH